MMIAPAARICGRWPRRLGLRPAKISAPNSVGMSAVSMMSLTATGRPWRGPGAPRPPVSGPRARPPQARRPDRDKRRREAQVRGLRCDRETRASSRRRRVRPDASGRPANTRTGPESRAHLCALRGRRPDEQARKQPLNRPVAGRGVEDEQNRDQEHPVEQPELLRVDDDVAEPGLGAEIFRGENRAPAGAKAKQHDRAHGGQIAGRITVR